MIVIAGLVAVLASNLTGGGSGPAHSISTPSRLMAYTQEPALAAGMGAQALRSEIVKKGNGEASHVVDAVYEDSTSAAAKSGPLIILFIGGNLSGSASSFISSFTGLLPSAFVTSPGSMGGQAAWSRATRVIRLNAPGPTTTLSDLSPRPRSALLRSARNYGRSGRLWSTPQVTGSARVVLLLVLG